MTNLRTFGSGTVGGYRPVAGTKDPWHLEAWPSVRDGAVEAPDAPPTFITLSSSSFQGRLRPFGSRRARSRAGTASERGCYRSRRSSLPCALRRNVPGQVGWYGPW